MLFDFLGLPGSLEEQATEFLEKARQDIQWAQDSIIVFLDFHKQRVRRKELAAGTLKNYYRAAKLFCEMNDLTTINWKRISKGLPRVKNSSSDRAPTLEEIRKLVEYPDRRIKPIIYAMASYTEPDVVWKGLVLLSDWFWFIYRWPKIAVAGPSASRNDIEYSIPESSNMINYR